MLERVFDQAQLTGPDRKLPAAIRVKHGVNRAGKTLHYFFNFSAAQQRVSYGYPAGTELLSGHPVPSGGEIALEPWGVAIVEQ